MSVVPKESNLLYSFITNGLDGHALSNNGFAYTINSSEITRCLPAGEDLMNYIINYDSKTYILVGVMEGAEKTPITETPETETPKEEIENKTTKTKEEKIIMYGGLGIGGVFMFGLIGLTFKKKVRVA